MSTSFGEPPDFLSAALKLSTEKVKVNDEVSQNYPKVRVLIEELQKLLCPKWRLKESPIAQKYLDVYEIAIYAFNVISASFFFFVVNCQQRG